VTNEVVDFSKNYKQARLEFDRLNKICQLGLSVSGAEISNIPFLFRGVFRLTSDIFQLIQNRRDALKTVLLKLDLDAPCTDLLQPSSEEMLWQNRTKAYEYRF
jgi:hypothetical protein